MANFFTQLINTCFELIIKSTQMFAWLFNPLFELDGVKIAPWALLSIGSLGIIFTFSLIHLLNPLN